MNNKAKGSVAYTWLKGPASILLTYSLVAVLSLALFGIIHSLSGNSLLGLLETTGSLILLLNIIILRLGYLAAARNILLTIVFLFLIVMLLTGGTQNTGAFWVFVFPVMAFFLAGKHAGIWWMLALIFMIASVWLLSATALVEAAYDGVTLRQLAISVAVVTIGIYVYQHTREQLTVQGNESRAQLRNEKVKAVAIVQNISEGIITTNSKGVITYSNPAAERLLGWTLKELVGKHYIDAIPMNDVSGRLVKLENRPLYRALTHRETITLTAAYRRKDREFTPVAVTTTPLLVDEKMIGAITTFRDITEEQSAARAKSEFLTLMSHQLRTPLGAIAWSSELLLSGDAGKLSREQREHITTIHQSDQRMKALVSEMLIVSNLDLHLLPVIPQKTNIKQLVSHIIKERVGKAGKNHAAIVEEYDNNLPEWSCDPEIVSIILRNLLTNALKYTPPEGKVTVSVRSDHRRPGQSHDDEGSIELIVNDTGYGIPVSETSKVFSKFFRAKNITQKDTDGTGLGLYIVKTLLDYIGGNITFSSIENKGTTFVVTFPLKGMERYEPERLGRLPATYPRSRHA
ncbi:MAG TPA: ATP-binding protein [Candidatus Saccharimonadales bacterium]